MLGFEIRAKWDTGLRIRFFALIAIAIFINTVFVTLVYMAYLREERLQLIDSQIRESALVLVESEFAALKKIDFERADDIISEELGANRIGKFFVVRNNKDEIVFESFSAVILGREFPREPQWITLEEGPNFIRVLNLKLPNRPDRTLQVGVVLDRAFMGWGTVGRATFTYLFFASLGVILISFALTLLLLKPFRLLVEHIRSVSGQLRNLSNVEPIPESIAGSSESGWFRSDEFSQLISALQGMINRINLNNRLTRVWSARMAHEFKTPLSIIRARVEASDKAAALPEARSLVLSEVEGLSNIVSEFLSWAELETSQRKGELHALKVGESVKSVAARLESLGDGRLDVKVDKDFVAVIFPTHLDQLLSNLISNALKFSPSDAKVEIRVTENAVKIVDRGEGLPLNVLERMGQPFNIGHHRKNGRRDSTGLGLAIANSIAKLYSIELRYFRLHDGSEWNLKFEGV